MFQPEHYETRSQDLEPAYHHAAHSDVEIMIKTTKDLSWSKIDSFTGNRTHAALLNHRSCPICGGLQQRTVLAFDAFQFFTDSARDPKRAKVQEVQCQDCHAVFLNPCYSQTGFRYLFAEAGQSYGSTEGRPREQMDVGCYQGQFLSLLPKGVRRLGVDIDAPAIARGRALYGAGIELIHGALETFKLPLEPDVISMFHVLEHLADPFAVLGHLRSISHHETRLVIEVPVLEHGKTNDINGFLSVQHMTHFSLQSLGQVLSRAGWQILERHQLPDYNGQRVLAKPGEVSAAVIGNVTDRSTLLEYFEHWYSNLAVVSRVIESWPKTSRAVIWGGGVHTELMYQTTPFFHQDPERAFVIVDSDPLKRGKSWRGLSIHAPDILESISWDDCRLIISSYGSQERIAQAAEKLGVPHSAVDRLYDRLRGY
jgi:hypothetical protein